jgi:hypothetical protein
MSKLLRTFFFGYAAFKYRRLIRTPIVLMMLSCFIVPIGVQLENYRFPDEEAVELVYRKYQQNIVNLNGNFLIADAAEIEQLTADNIARVAYLNKEQFIEQVRENDQFAQELVRREAYSNRIRDYRRYELGVEGLSQIDEDSFLVGLALLLALLAIVALISYLVEPFIAEKKTGASRPNPLEEEKDAALATPAVEPSIASSDDSEFIASKEPENKLKSDLPKGEGLLMLKAFLRGNPLIKKGGRILITVFVFFGLYFPLFTIPFYSGMRFLTPVVALLSFGLCFPLAKAIISKWFPSLND